MFYVQILEPDRSQQRNYAATLPVQAEAVYNIVYFNDTFEISFYLHCMKIPSEPDRSQQQNYAATLPVQAEHLNIETLTSYPLLLWKGLPTRWMWEGDVEERLYIQHILSTISRTIHNYNIIIIIISIIIISFKTLIFQNAKLHFYIFTVAIFDRLADNNRWHKILIDYAVIAAGYVIDRVIHR